MDNAPALAADARRERRRILGLSLPAATIITVIVFLPTLWLFALSFVEGEAFSWAHYQRMIDSTAYFKIFRQTFEISITVTALSLLLGYPLAYLMAQLPRRAANLCLVLVFIPFWTSLLVRTYAWLVLLQRKGLINAWLLDVGLVDTPIRLVHNYTGTVIGMLHIMLPFLILPTYNALKSIDPNFMLAAANLGASPVRAFWTVFFPLSMPGVIAGSLLVFILCLGFYVTPALLGGGKVTMVSMQIQQNAALYFDWGAASALGVVLLAVTMLLFLVIGRVLPLDRLMGGR
jgi:putative spermidine/putrescine transport system permease protein/spermidine/putrescine transport system permease protein